VATPMLRKGLGTPFFKQSAIDKINNARRRKGPGGPTGLQNRPSL
jgi:hypothetical protein